MNINGSKLRGLGEGVWIVVGVVDEEDASAGPQIFQGFVWVSMRFVIMLKLVQARSLRQERFQRLDGLQGCLLTQGCLLKQVHRYA